MPGRSLQFTLLSGLNVCKTYDISGEDLFYKWEASTFNMDRLISDKTITNIEAVVKNSIAKAQKQKQKLQGQMRNLHTPRGRPGMDPFFGRRSGAQLGTVSSMVPASLPRSSGGAGTVTGRHKVALRLETKAEHNNDCAPLQSPPNGLDVLFTDKYMYEKLTDRSEGVPICQILEASFL